MLQFAFCLVTRNNDDYRTHNIYLMLTIVLKVTVKFFIENKMLLRKLSQNLIPFFYFRLGKIKSRKILPSKIAKLRMREIKYGLGNEKTAHCRKKWKSICIDHWGFFKTGFTVSPILENRHSFVQYARPTCVHATEKGQSLIRMCMDSL